MKKAAKARRRTAVKKAKAPRRPDDDFTIDEWCAKRRITKPHFYELLKRGLAPKTMKLKLPQPYVKWAVEPARAADVPRAIARAYHLAMQPPCGPVLVSVPVDDWAQPAEAVVPRRVSQALRPEPALLREIASSLNAAERPAFVVGAAIDRDAAWDATVQLAEAHRARVFHAPMSGRCGFPNEHPSVRRLPEPDARAHRRAACRSRLRAGHRRAGLHLSRRR